VDVLVGPHVPGREELVVGHDAGVVGHRQRAAGEVGAVVQGQQVARAGLQLPADVGAEGVGGGGVGAVDLRAVEEGGDAVDLLPRVAGAGAGGRVEGGAGGGLGGARGGRRAGARV